ncbi:MAG: peptidase M14, partial [Prevotellaceae bacterium]|nr:peptidase M14 [Prevotellaceae bacterium]
KGAAYGDIHGSVCILYEQLASRGHLRPTKNYGIMSFASTIRNQAFSGVSIVKGAYEMRKELLDYQRDYYKNSRRDAAKDPVKGYIFNTRGDRAVAYHFLDNLRRHRVDVYHLAAAKNIGANSYATADSYVIPTGQKYYATVRTLMEEVTQFDDSTFYDISTWTFPHAFNLQYNELSSVSGLLGERVGENPFPAGEVIGAKSNVAYLFENTQYYAPRMATELLRQGLIVKVSGRPFTYTPAGGEAVTLTYGTYIVPAQGQPLSPDDVYALVSRLSRECGITTYATDHGLMSDYDLGSTATKPLELPRVAVITGRGMGIPSSGEAWMMLDKRFQLPPTLIEYSTLGSVDLSRYNVIIMADGTPTTAVSDKVNTKLKAWTENGGTLIAIGSAYRWTNAAKISDFKLVTAKSADAPAADGKKAVKPAAYRSYASRSASSGNAVDGVILNCRLDATHPLGWGYRQSTLPVIRNASTAFQRPSDATASPLSYLDRPLLSGFISGQNLSRMADTPAAMVEGAGKGRVILLVDDPNFRMYWYGGTRLFMNAILFGQLL